MCVVCGGWWTSVFVNEETIADSKIAHSYAGSGQVCVMNAADAVAINHAPARAKKKKRNIRFII